MPSSARAMPATSPAPERDAPIERLVSEGQGVLVQVRQGPAAGKAPRVTGDIALVGLHLVYRPRRRGVALSARLARTPAAAEQRARAQALFPGAGVIAAPRGAGRERRGAPRGARPPARALGADRGRRGRGDAARALHGVDDPLHRLLLERSAPDLERIVVGDQASLVRARNWLAEWQPGMAVRLASVPGPSRRPVRPEQLEEALQPTVPLAGGGSLIIQPTAALTAIDVNGGGAAGRSMPTSPQRVRSPGSCACAGSAARSWSISSICRRGRRARACSRPCATP